MSHPLADDEVVVARRIICRLSIYYVHAMFLVYWVYSMNHSRLFLAVWLATKKAERRKQSFSSIQGGETWRAQAIDGICRDISLNPSSTWNSSPGTVII